MGHFKRKCTQKNVSVFSSCRSERWQKNRNGAKVSPIAHIYGALFSFSKASSILHFSQQRETLWVTYSIIRQVLQCHHQKSLKSPLEPPGEETLAGGLIAQTISTFVVSKEEISQYNASLWDEVLSPGTNRMWTCFTQYDFCQRGRTMWLVREDWVHLGCVFVCLC